jgi:uncharacterized membrane protein
MKTSRLEAFSDGVLAIIITIMVLELKVSHSVEPAVEAVVTCPFELCTKFYLPGHLLEQSPSSFPSHGQVSGGILWEPAFAVLAFALSFYHGLIGENGLAAIPTAVYGFVLLMAAIAYYILRARYHCQRRSRVPFGAGRWQGLEGSDFPCALFGRYPTGVCQSMDCQWTVRVRCAPLVDS